VDLAKLQQQIAAEGSKLPPVEKWDPAFCGDIDLQIKHDGSWYYMGTPIGRKPLVRLFSTVLKHEDDKYFLVTPVEKVGIVVDDVPFIITQWQQQDDKLLFTTQTDDTFIVAAEHPVELHKDKVSGDLLPYARVRRNLWARLHQNVFYQLVELGSEVSEENGNFLRLQSGDYQFDLGKL
jgi:hypothetical protein